MSLFNELKKRNVFRVGLAYIVSAWVIAQVVDLVLDGIKAPDWVMQALLLGLGLGFIAALIIAWAYELTPEGIKREKDVSRDDSITNITAKKLDYITLAAAFVVVALFIYQQMNPAVTTSDDNSKIVEVENKPALTNDNSRTTTVTPNQEENSTSNSNEKSIAVLPFADMSQAGDQEYFADGISEEILNVLVRIPTLKVAGRTSSFSFKGKDQDLRMIGDSLGVNHILEGSVRRSNTKLRITAQLIRSDDGFHLWSDTYDREIADIFDIQDEIARQVADQLVIALGLDIKTKDQYRTADLAVYENYLKAKQLFTQRGREKLDQALGLLKEATSRDPNYAPAWTLTAHIYGVYEAYASNEEVDAKYKQWFADGRDAAQRAIKLDPQSGEAYAALGSYDFYDFDFISGVENYERALELAADNPIVLDTVAQNYLEIGYSQKSKQLAEKAIGIDPLVAMYRNTIGQANLALNQDQTALKNFEKAIDLDETLVFPYNNLQNYYLLNQKFDQFKAVTERRLAIDINEGPLTKIGLELLNDKTLIADKAALQRLARESDGWKKYLLNRYLNNVDFVAKIYEQVIWSGDQRFYPELFGPNQQPLYAHDRWKQQVRTDGVLALWQAKGFPAHCKPIGDDDFECDMADEKK